MLLSLGGSDQIQAREFDLQTLEFVSGGIETPLARQFLAWAGDDEVFVSLVAGSSDQTTSGLPRTVRKLRRGETLENAVVVHSCEENDLYTRGWSVVGKQALLHVFLTQHSMQKSTLTIEQNGERKTLNLPREADKIVTDRHVIWQPNGSTEAQQGFVLMRLLNDSKSDRVLFQPKTNSAVNRILATRDCIVLLGRDGATPWLRAIDIRKSGTSIHEIPLLDRISHIDVSWFAVDPDGPVDSEGDPRLNIVAQSLLHNILHNA